MPTTNTNKDQVDRATLFSMWMRNISPVTLARTYGLTVEEIMVIVDEEKATYPSRAPTDARQFFADHSLRIEALIEDAAAAAHRERGFGRLKSF